MTVLGVEVDALRDAVAFKMLVPLGELYSGKIESSRLTWHILAAAAADTLPLPHQFVSPTL